MDDNQYKKQELAKFIWNLIKDKTQATYTDTDHNEIDKKAELLGLQKYEIIEIKNNQQKKLVLFIEEEEKRKEEERQEAIRQAELEKVRIEQERLEALQEAPDIKIIEEPILSGGETEEILAEPEPKKSYLYPILGVLGVILLIGVGIFIFNLGKKTNSNSANQTIVLGNTVDLPKVQEIPFQELMGEYAGSVNNETISVKIFLEGTNTRYSYSKSKGSSYLLFHYGATNELNFGRPKEDLAKFIASKEGNTIILRSPNVELRKVK